MSEHMAVPEPIEPAQLGIGSLFDRVRDAVVVGDAASGRIVLWNAAAEDLFGYTREEAFGLLIEDLVPAELKTQHRIGISRYAREGRGPIIDSQSLIELPALRKDGSRVVVEFTLTPLEGATLGGPFVLAILRDATARTELHRKMEETERALRDALAREREASRRLREIDELRAIFVAMVAHDVRSPLTSVKGFANYLAGQWENLPPQERLVALQSIERSVDRVARLAEDVLLVAALETGSVPINAEPVRIADAIRDALESLDSGDVRFEQRLESDLRVIADPHRLWQVLTNLFGNAVKFAAGDRPVEIEVRHEGSDVELKVRDHGPGIPREDRSRLFERFARRDDARAVPGSGLGLYIAHQLVGLMGGEIDIADDADIAGTTFVIRLPAAP